MPRRALLAVLLIAIGAAAHPAFGQVLRDANCDGVVDGRDASALVDALFVPPAPPCSTADVNRDGRLSAADLIALALGPRISFIGLASLDGRPAPSLGTLQDGTPVYYHSSGFGFLVVIEAVPSADTAPAGTTLFNSAPNNPSRQPDLQILVDRPLGDGNPAVCDDDFGVPAVDPPSFAPLQPVSDALNDLACRFNAATTRSGACTQDSFGQPAFVAPNSRTQFCLAVNSEMGFSTGETHMTVRLRDANGLIGPVREMILEIGGPPPPTFTPQPPTATPTATATASTTSTASATRTATFTATQTATPPPPPTRTETRTPTASSTPTQAPPSASPTATDTAPPTPIQTSTTGLASATPTAQPPTATSIASSTSTVATPTSTRPRTTPVGGCAGDCDGSGDVTVSELITLVNIGLGTSDVSLCPAGDVNGDNQISVAEIVQAVANAVNGCAPPTRAATATPARVPSATKTAAPPTPTAPGATSTPAGTPTPLATSTPTGTAAPIGPVITFLGLTRSDDFLLDPSCSTCSPPVYEPPFGYNFSIIVEAAPGGSRLAVDNSTFNPVGTPALQIESTSALGNGSTAVCDDMPPLLGGVPAVNPPDFNANDPAVADRLNDFGCRFVDGTGLTLGRNCSPFTACILGNDGEFSCHGPGTTVQFCGAIGQILAFPSGDTVITARVADKGGNLGPPAQLIIRVP